jgi:hypothetical protein
MGTKDGQIKKTEIEKYENIRKTGIVAMGLKGSDELKWVKSSGGKDIIVEVSEKGQAICYSETDVRPMGRSASGVTGMRLRSGDKVMAMDVVPFELTDFDSTSNSHRGPDMLVVLENGFGKRTILKNFHLQKRGGMGIRAANCTPKTGNLIGMHITYSEKGDVILASQKGQFIRMELVKIKRLGRDTQGVTLMKMRQDDKVASVALILPDETIQDENQSKIQPNGNPPDQKPSAPTLQPGSSHEAAGNKKIKVNYYEKNKMDEKIVKKEEMAPVSVDENLPMTSEEILPEIREDSPAGGLPEKPTNVLPATESEFKVKNYKDETPAETSPEDNPSADGRKNPPIPKDDVNYWGGKK